MNTWQENDVSLAPLHSFFHTLLLDLNTKSLHPNFCCRLVILFDFEVPLVLDHGVKPPLTRVL